MLSRTCVVAVALFSSLAVAQNNSTYIDPSTVDLSTRASWCGGQSSACDTLCDSSTDSNSCDDTTLIYNCTCGNGSAPDLAAYMDTMPYYICEESYSQCMDEHPSTDPDGQALCASDIQDECGTLNLADYTAPASTSASATASSTSASGTASSTASTTSASASATASGAAIALSVGKECGVVVLATAIFGAFSYLL